MESVRGEDCQDPIPATLTLDQAEMQGRDRTDPAQGAGTRPAVAGTARAASPAWSFAGSCPPGSPKLTGMSVPSCVAGPQACASTVLIGRTPWHLLNYGRKEKRAEKWKKDLGHGQLPGAGCKEGCVWGGDSVILGPDMPPCTLGRGRPGRVLFSAMTDVSPGKWIPMGRC